MSSSMQLMAEILKLPPTLETLEIDSSDGLWQIPRSCEEQKKPIERINYASYLALLSSLNRETPFPLLNKAHLLQSFHCRIISPLLAILLSNITVLSGYLLLPSLGAFPRLESVAGSVIFDPSIEPNPSLKHIFTLELTADDYPTWMSRGITCDSLLLTGPSSTAFTHGFHSSLTYLELNNVDLSSIIQSHPIWTETLPPMLESFSISGQQMLNDLLVSKLP